MVQDQATIWGMGHRAAKYQGQKFTVYVGTREVLTTSHSISGAGEGERGSQGSHPPDGGAE